MLLSSISNSIWLSEDPENLSLTKEWGNPETEFLVERLAMYCVFEVIETGERFIHFNTHIEIPSNSIIQTKQTEVLVSYVDEIRAKFDNIPAVVTGDFNTQGVVNKTLSYNTMIAGGFADSSRIAKEGEAKTTFTDMNSENSGIIFDYIFVSSELKDSVETYYVCPAKVDGQWVSDHNAIVGTIVIRKA